MLCKEQGKELDCLVVSKEKEDAYLPFLPTVKPIEIVVEVAEANHGKLPMAVASGGMKHIIEQVLEHLKIRHYFDAVVTSEDVKHQKPAPDIFLEAARRIGIPPQFCRAYEDTDLGLQAIRSAGMEAIDVRELLPSPRFPRRTEDGGLALHVANPLVEYYRSRSDIRPGAYLALLTSADHSN